MTSDDVGEDGFQVVLRRLENGDYLRVILERDGPGIELLLAEDGEEIVHGFRLELTARGLAEVVRELMHAQVHAAQRDAGHASAQAATLADAQLRLTQFTGGAS